MWTTLVMCKAMAPKLRMNRDPLWLEMWKTKAMCEAKVQKLPSNAPVRVSKEPDGEDDIHHERRQCWERQVRALPHWHLLYLHGEHQRAPSNQG